MKRTHSVAEAERTALAANTPSDNEVYNVYDDPVFDESSEESRASERCAVSAKRRKVDAAREAEQPQDPQHLWHLMTVHPSHGVCNEGSLSLLTLFASPPKSVLFADYMIDPVWLASAFPYLRTPGLVDTTLWLSDTGGTLQVPQHWKVAVKKGFSSYGSHHSKFVLAFYSGYLRVAIHTANLLYCDINNKAQGIWHRDFPLKKGATEPSSFEKELTEYLVASGWKDAGDASLSRYDMSSVRAEEVRLIGSIPGRHTQNRLNTWGHMKLRRVLSGRSATQNPAIPDDERAEIYLQFSSVGSLNEKWIGEFIGDTLGAKAGMFVKTVWPTENEVRSCVEGYNGGRSIPGSTKNVQKMMGFLGPTLFRWGGNPLREVTPPHIKTYTKVRREKGGERRCGGVEWSVLTSSNLSMAAWGKLEKNGTQLFIMNYELGLVFLPGAPGQCRPQMAQMRNPAPLVVPLPFPTPPTPYTETDIPWVCDKDKYGEEDCFGMCAPSGTPILGISQ